MANKRTKSSVPSHPFRGFFDVMSEMNRAQTQWMLGHGKASAPGARSHSEAYVPPADIFASGQDLVVRCEIPGVRSDDVSVTVAGGMLTIAGHRESQLDEDTIVYHTRERVYGSFRRTMILPEGVEQKDVEASIRNGLLEIIVRGGAAGKPKTVDIVDENED